MKFNAGNIAGMFQKVDGLHGNGKVDFVKFLNFGAIFKKFELEINLNYIKVKMIFTCMEAVYRL